MHLRGGESVGKQSYSAADVMTGKLITIIHDLYDYRI
jgi:hypothetical protein